ncbi:hypothetical protein NKG94_40355 [Micromonospora sp. M12]
MRARSREQRKSSDVRSGVAGGRSGGAGAGRGGRGGDARDRAARLVGTVAAALTLLATVPLVFGRGDLLVWSGDEPAVRPWHQLDLPWVPGLELRFHLGVDGISWPLVVLTALLTLLCCAYTMWRVPDGGSGRALVALLLVVEVGILGTFLALDLVLFFLFFEVVLLPMYAIIAGWGGADRRRAARSSRSTRCSARCCCSSACMSWLPPPAPPTWWR